MEIISVKNNGTVATVTYKVGEKTYSSDYEKKAYSSSISPNEKSVEIITTKGKITVPLSASVNDVTYTDINQLQAKLRFFFSVGGSGGGGGNYKGGWNPKTNTPDIYTTAKDFDDFVVVEDLEEDEVFSFDFGAKGGIISLTNNDRVVFNGSNYVKQEYLVPDASEIPMDRNDAGKGSVLEVINSNQSGLQAEITARQNADNVLQNNINAEATARANADNVLQNNITAEATARANADTAINSAISGLEAVVAYRDNAVLKYIPNPSESYNAGNFIKDTLTGETGLVMQNFSGGAKFIDLVNNGTIQTLPIGSRSPFPILDNPDQNTNYNNEHGYATGSEIEYQGDVWIYLEEDANGVPTWVLKENTEFFGRSFELVGEYADGTIITVSNAIGLPDADYTSTNNSLFASSFKANYIIDGNQPLFDILDLNGNVVNSLPLRYLSSAENPIKNDGDLPLEVPRGTNGEIITQKDLNDYLYQRGDTISYKGKTSFNPTINIVSSNIAITGTYTRLANRATIGIIVTFSGTLNNNSVFEFDLSSLGTCSDISGIAYYSDDSKARPQEGIVVPSDASKFNLASEKSYWSNSHPVTGVSVGDAIYINLTCQVAEWSETSPQFAKGLIAGNGIQITESATDYTFSATAQSGVTYGDSQNYWVFKNVQDNPTAFIYNTLQKAHDAFLASGKSLGYIFMGAGQYTDPCTITATNLNIEGAGNGSRSQTQQNGKITITGHRATFKNILFGNASATSPVEINCSGILTENGVPNIGRGKPVFDNCSWSLANGVAPITITALNNWATFSFCDFGGKGALTLPDNATPVSWYYLFSSCSNVGLIRGSNTITAIDSNSVSVIDISAQPTATAFRGNQLVTWVLGTPVFKGHFYYHNGVIYLAKNTVASSITAPNLDATNFQNALYTTSPTIQYNVSDTLNAPPASPIDGETYLVGTSPTGAYAGKSNNIAVYSTSTSTWSFIAPSTSIAVIFTGGANAGKIATWNSTAWVVSLAVSSDPFPIGFEYDGYLSPGVGWVDISINRVTLSKTTYATLWNLIPANLKKTTDNASTIGMYIDLGASGFQTPKAGGTFKRPVQGAQNVGSYVADSIASHNHGYRLGAGFQDQAQGGNSRFFSPDYNYGIFYDYTTWNTGSTETAPKHTTTKRWLKVI